MIKRIKKYITTPEKLPADLLRPFQYFFQAEASSSILLVAATVFAFLWANSVFSSSYHGFWQTEFSLVLGDYSISKTLREWIDEGFMTIFFFIVGLEIKREILVGELATLKKALLPAGAAIGGMLFPALIYFAFNRGLPTVGGWGIPMATDIAFAMGAVSVLGRRLPSGIRIFLSALAIVDDLGAVIVIALFYTEKIVAVYLFAAIAIFLLTVIANLLWIRKTLVYAILGIALWLAFLGSGLHATVAGVIVAMCIPARGKYPTEKFMEKVEGYLGQFGCPSDGCGYSILLNEKHMDAVQSIELACHDVETPLQRLEHSLHPWVVFVIVPLFALANAGLTIGKIDIPAALTSPVMLGILCGLLFGKPLGITLFSWLAVKMKLCSLPAGVTWAHIFGTGILGGIGFTMSLFITELSFRQPAMMDYAKVGVLLGSIGAGVTGLLYLYAFSSRKHRT
ncbi:MAG: Na+/H+ antiporter NhaA [Candidatus Sulfobium sp.]